MRLTVLALLICSVAQLRLPAQDLYGGWLKMYDLKFDEAHKIFADWNRSHPADPLGPTSDAAAYLFSEFARLGVLESELFTDDSRYKNRGTLRADPRVKALFESQIERADHLAGAALDTSANDGNALFAKSLTCGLRADFAALIERQDFTAFRYVRLGRVFAERLIAADPDDYDAYLGPGVENYLLSLKPPPVRAMLWLTGARMDREKGIEQLRKTAQHGHYLEPFAKLLLAVAAVRDHDRAKAREVLSELHDRFPDNPLYLKELTRLGQAANSR